MVQHCRCLNKNLCSLKSRGLTAWLWLFKNASQAKAAMKPSTRPGLAWPIWARLGPAHGLRPGLAQPYFKSNGVFLHTVYFLAEVLILGAYILVPYYVLLLVVSIVDFWSISEFTVSLILWVLREYILDFMHHIILFLTTSESFVLIFLLHLISTMCQCGCSIL